MADEPIWTALYPDGLSAAPPHVPTSLVTAWRDRVAASPESPCLIYFDSTLTVRRVDDDSDALAAHLQDRGVGRGDVVGVQLQNIPQFAIAMLALWKVGATVLILNPMYRGGELRRLIDDSRAIGFIGLDREGEEAASTLAGSTVAWRMTTSDLDLQSEDDPRLFEDAARVVVDGADDLLTAVQENAGRTPSAAEVRAEDAALLTYTSGTTGPPKGALNTHRNVLSTAVSFNAWQGIGAGDVVLAVAPLFHITGAVATAAATLISDAPLVFINRLHPEVMLESFNRHRVSVTVGAITVYNALLALDRGDAADLGSVRWLYSGGAPIPPSTVERFQERFGHYIHNIYGMTETASAVIGVPPEARAPVDDGSGTLSIGVPLPGLDARAVDTDGREVAAGQEGELQMRGPQVMPEYLRKPEETAHVLSADGWLSSGDVAIIDEDGWIYLVDRLKDQINASGFKVWPREVEDALYEHPDVYEAAVVGAPDEYRGETVTAYVSLRPGSSTTAAALQEFTKERLAAYKYPRHVHIIDELPKTQTGKIKRRDLRDAL
ncbi:MAG: class I adenylate-forming enzyme family protein [Brevibacterium yomogidense]|uniref:class I adenylate-forming enzyme family protein n=1 Tax=Brevibacterium sp. Mu109 TaxID=1255669 RepID=UPI000C6AC1E1|nr:AMP-binding protein [Brevibacterium sp. Mu109]SMX73415.1 long-chain acyl-CoA synthetase [Brevibacterium sp. Mu109]